MFGNFIWRFQIVCFSFRLLNLFDNLFVVAIKDTFILSWTLKKFEYSDKNMNTDRTAYTSNRCECTFSINPRSGFAPWASFRCWYYPASTWFLTWFSFISCYYYLRNFLNYNGKSVGVLSERMLQKLLLPFIEEGAVFGECCWVWNSGWFELRFCWYCKFVVLYKYWK